MEINPSDSRIGYAIFIKLFNDFVGKRRTNGRYNLNEGVGGYPIILFAAIFLFERELSNFLEEIFDIRSGKSGCDLPHKIEIDFSGIDLGQIMLNVPISRPFKSLAELASGPHCAKPSKPQQAESPSPDGV
jgi:hypothetical protein